MPNKKNYIEREIVVNLYNHFSFLRYAGKYWECSYCKSTKCHEECEMAEQDRQRNNPMKAITIPLEEMTLQDIIDLLPIGVNPADIKIGTGTGTGIGNGGIGDNIEIDNGDCPNGYNITFYYRKTILAEPERYQIDIDIYNKKRDEYKIKLAKYDALQVKIKEKELKKKN